MINLQETKKQLRQAMLKCRRSLPPQDIADGSAKIAAHFATWPAYRDSRTVMLYIPMPDEPQTEQMISRALADGKIVCVPMLRAEYGFMDAARIEGLDDLITGKLGLKMPDPTKAQRVAPGDIDLVVVPGVAFDALGNRLGMGAGYYDRFLPQAGQIGTVGLAWSFQIVPTVPCGEYDIKMQYLLTENGFQSCR